VTLLESDPCEQVAPQRPKEEIVMPPAKKVAPAAKKAAAKAKAAPAKAAAQATVTLKHLAAELADNHDLAKKQAEAVLGDLVTLATKHLKKGR
jgi:DNA-binding protein HU-beta